MILFDFGKLKYLILLFTSIKGYIAHVPSRSGDVTGIQRYKFTLNSGFSKGVATSSGLSLERSSTEPTLMSRV